MLDPLLLKKKAATGGGGNNSIQPLWGVNYSANSSTGRYTPTSRSGTTPIAPPISLAGYTTVLKNLDTVNYAAGSRTSISDFTAICRVLIVGASGYVTLMNSSFTFRLGDSGFGNRLQFGYAMSSLATCWDSSITNGQLASAWYHVAMVRKSNVNTIYINGSAIMLANGTGSSYAYANFSDSTSMINYNSMSIGSTSVNIYTAEWGLWDSAIITGNFTPPVGGLF